MKAKLLILAFSLLLATNLYAQDYTNPPLEFKELDGSPDAYPYQVLVPNGTMVVTGGIIELQYGGGSSGSGTMTSITAGTGVTLIPNPITISGTVAIGQDISTTANPTFANITATNTATSSVVDTQYIDNSTTPDITFRNTGNVVASGAIVETSLEIPNGAGDVICDAAGEIAVDSTQKQLAVNDGIEVAIPLRHVMYGPLYLTGAYDIATDYPLIFLDSTVFPDGIVITSWSISSTNADPTTELNANLTYCDDPTTGAFPGANPVLVDVLDTTTGNASESTMASSDLGSGIIPADKVLYIDMDVDSTDTDHYWIWKMEYYIPES